MWGHAAQDVLIEGGRGRNVEGQHTVSGNRRHEVRGKQGLQRHPVCRHAREVPGGMLHHHIGMQAVIRNRTAVCGLGKRVKVASLGVRTSRAFEVVTDAIFVQIGGTIASAYTHRVQLASVAVAISCGDVRTTAVINGTRSVANATRIQRTYAVICVIADAVVVGVSRTGSSANAQSILLVSIAVAVTGGNVRTPAGVNGTGAIANAASVQFTYAVIRVVANSIIVGIGSAGAAANVQRVELVAVAIAIAHRKV